MKKKKLVILTGAGIVESGIKPLEIVTDSGKVISRRPYTRVL
jgi:hypothetical protein